jgi:hypothetical protein
MNTYGIATASGEYIEVSNTERGAKNYATRNDYKEVFIRYNNGYYIQLIASKDGNKWNKSY